jgi:hypothetical protein
MREERKGVRDGGLGRGRERGSELVSETYDRLEGVLVNNVTVGSSEVGHEDHRGGS